MPPSTTGPEAGAVRLRLFGGLALEGRSDRDLGSRKGRQVLKALAVARGRPVGAEALVEVAWGDRPPARPGDLGVLVSRLRAVVGAEHLVRTDAGYCLRDVWIDLDELHARVAHAAAALERGQLGSARASAEAAVALARGELLPGDDGDWLLAARAAAGAQIARAHHIVAASAELAGDHLAAAAAAEAALGHDPYDEVALRILMRANADAGRVASALAAYVRVRDRVVEDLGVGLGPETEALHDQLVLGGAPWEPSSRPAADLVGRDAELAVLDTCLGDVQQRAQARLLLVRGEAGIGKSAVLAAWVRALEDRAVVLSGRCDELGRDLPMQPLADAVSEHLRGAGPAERERCLGDDRAALADLLGLPGAAPGAFGVTDAAGGRSRLFAALLSVVERIGSDRPVVVVIDDAHLADPLTLGWVGFAQRRGRRMLLVLAGRPGGPDIALDQELVIGPLDRRHTAELVGVADGPRLEAIHDRGGGNPLFLLALAAAPDDELPGSVREAVRRQAAALGPASETLTAAAVLGSEVDLDLLADVVHRPAAEVLADLESAITAGLLDDRGGSLAFRHELVRAALAETATSPRRRLLHRDAARTIALRPGADPLTVAVHARLGGDTRLAIDGYVGAGLEALARFDVEAAGRHLETAIGLGGSEEAFAARARLRMAVQDLDAAAEDAASAMSLGGSVATLETAGWVAYYRRRYDEARRLAETGVLRAGDDAARRASCQAIVGRVRHGSGDLRGAAQWLAGIDGAPPPVQGVVDVWLANCQVHQGDMKDALDTLERPLRDPDHLAHPWAGMHGRFAAVMALGHLGRLGEALARCDELDAAVDRGGPVGSRFAGPAANVRAWLLRHSGALEEADECNDAALVLTTGPGDLPLSESVMEFHYVALLDLADGRLLAGDPGGASAVAERLAPVDCWQGTMAWHQRHRLGLLRARLALLDGDRDAAAGHAVAVRDDAAARGAHRYELLAAAWLALASGDGDLRRLDGIVTGLASVAALEGWRLAASLGRAFDNRDWVEEAGRRAAALVAAAGPRADRLRAAVAAELG